MNLNHKIVNFEFPASTHLLKPKNEENFYPFAAQRSSPLVY